MNAAELDVLLTQVRRANEAEDWASAIVLYQRVLVEGRRTVERRVDDARANLERALALTTRYSLDLDRRALLARIADAFEFGLGDELQAHRIRKQLRR